MNIESSSGFRLRRTNNRRAKEEEQKDEQRSFDNPPNKPTAAIPTYCLVSGSLALTLRLSRIAGIAPLTFQKQGLGLWEIRKSRGYFIYSVILIVTLNATALSGLAMDFTIEEEQVVRMRTPAKSVVFFVNVVLVGLTISVGAFTAPSRMEAIIVILSRIQKINSELNNNTNIPAHIEKRLKYLVTFLVCFSAFTILFHLYMQLTYSITNDRNRTIVFLYFAFYFLNANLIFINLQFAINMIAISRVLRSINDQLDHLCRFIKNGGLQDMSEESMIERHEIPYDITVPLKSVNIVIDRITFHTDILLPRKRKIHETIRALALSYLDICEMMEEMNKSFGVITIMRLLIILIHLTMTAFYFLTMIFTHPEFNGMVLIQSLWYIRHLITMFLMVEPCHSIYQEFIRTRRLLVHLTCWTATVAGPFALELRRFFYCICLNNIKFTPMGICTLTRPLSVSILGAVTTYLVVVFQFNIDDDVYDR